MIPWYMYKLWLVSCWFLLSWKYFGSSKSMKLGPDSHKHFALSLRGKKNQSLKMCFFHLLNLSILQVWLVYKSAYNLQALECTHKFQVWTRLQLCVNNTVHKKRKKRSVKNKFFVRINSKSGLVTKEQIVLWTWNVYTDICQLWTPLRLCVNNTQYTRKKAKLKKSVSSIFSAPTLVNKRADNFVNLECTHRHANSELNYVLCVNKTGPISWLCLTLNSVLTITKCQHFFASLLSVECLAHEPKIPPYPWNTLGVNAEFPASISANSLLTVSRVMKQEKVKVKKTCFFHLLSSLYN